MLHTSTALQRPVTTTMTFVALVVVGLIALHLLPLEEFPDVTFPGMQVIIPDPGSTPEEVEQLITRPVEEALSTLSGIEGPRRPHQARFDPCRIARRRRSHSRVLVQRVGSASGRRPHLGGSRPH